MAPTVQEAPSLQEELARAEALIDEGWRRIRRQRELIARLSRKGLDTAVAQKLLYQFEEVQRLQMTKRDHLLAELLVAQPQAAGNDGL